MKELSLSQFKDVQSKFFQAYLDFTDKKIVIEEIASNPTHPVILGILSSMADALKDADDFDPERDLNKNSEALSFGTLKNLLFTRDDFFINGRTLNFQPTVYARIEKYIYLSTLTEDKNLFTGKFKGAYSIDGDFKKRLLENNRPFEKTDFYTSNLNKNIQWRGIAKGLNVERSVLYDLRKAVGSAFKQKNCKICAVVLGRIGSGKTTMLRVLAWELISKGDFEILWINDLSGFVAELSQIKDIKKNYLLIIDNWPSIENNPGAKSKFLMQITDIDNIRVVIGDTSAKKRDYAHHVYGGNYFHLNNAENVGIIKEIQENVEEWRSLDSRIEYFNPEFFKAPLQLILCVLATFDQSDNKNPKIDKKDFFAQIVKIVEDILNDIYQRFHGLAMAISQWAHISYKYNLYLSMNTLIALGALFSGDSLNLQYNEAEEAVELMLYLTTGKRLIVPKRQDFIWVAFGAHAILEAITQIDDKRFNCNEATIFQFFQGLIKVGDLAVATDLYLHIYEHNRYITDDIKIGFSRNTGPLNQSFLILVGLHAYMMNTYAYFDIMPEEKLEEQLLFIIKAFYMSGLGSEEINVFFSKLIDCNCQSPAVLELFSGTGEYAYRMIELQRKKGRKYITKSEFYKELGKYSGELPDPENPSWFELLSAEESDRIRKLTKEMNYAIK